jgi:hypothetical protein
MSLLLLILWIILLIVIVRKFRRVGKRIDHLEQVIADLKNEMGEKTSQAIGPAAEPEAPPPPPEPAAPEKTVIREESSLTAARPIDFETVQPIGSFDSQFPKAFSRKPFLWRAKWQSFTTTVDWEQFTGVKLFAWLGGLALFIAAGFFVKYSIDRNLIPPTLRLAVSAVIGVGLIIGSGRFSETKYQVMRHTLAAAGIGVLYSVVFAATLYYAYLTKPVGFGLLTIISAAAFVLAIFHNSRAVSILGALGAYATPVLVSTDHGSLILLFGYLTVVNLGLYQVARRLKSQGLFFAAAAGTCATLGLGTWHMFEKYDGIIIAVTWLLNLALFVIFLAHTHADPQKKPIARWTGTVVFLFTLAVATALLTKPGWFCLLLVTAEQAAIMGLAWRHRGWYPIVVPYAAVEFLVVMVWVLFKFEPAQVSMGFLLLLLYGTFGGLGPLVLVWRYGISRRSLFWFRVFPLAIVSISLAVVVKQPVLSFWFWPLLLGLELIGIGISIVFRAFIQVGLLVFLFVIGALHWLSNVPDEMLGIGFFLFVMGAGIILCFGLFLLIKRLPRMRKLLALDKEEAGVRIPVSDMADTTQWLAAAPAAGVFMLLAASFLIAYPYYPHPGMLTLACFLILVLFAIHRLEFELPGVAALLSAAAAQAVFVLHPVLGPPVFFHALAWSGSLFLLGLVAPFMFFQDFRRWKTIWNGWALFEAAQAVFILYASQRLWPDHLAQWMPLLLAGFKLPLVAILLRRLKGRPERNVILAFHGAVLLFYLSTLPVLVLERGWIGLTFVLEAAGLLWLNRRIEHPGLRWAALGMAPLGLVILVFSLPLLKSLESLAIINGVTLSVAAAVLALAFAVRQAGYPQRLLSKFDLPNIFLWFTLAAGFLFINLVVTDLFAQPKTIFTGGYPLTLLMSQTPAMAAAAAAGWMIYGVGLLLWPKHLDQPFRLAGVLLTLLAISNALILPFKFRMAFAQMPPLFNWPSTVYLLCLAFLIFLTIRKWTQGWPLTGTTPRTFWGITLAMVFFGVLNIEIASIFAIKGRPFSMMARGSLAMQLAYSIGWLLYAIGLLVVGIRWDVVNLRWTAIVAIALTACKIFILDVSSLGQLYRVASLLGLAVVLILVSFLYQRFLAEGNSNGQ